MSQSEFSPDSLDKKVKLLTIGALVLLVTAFFSPIWWVSLTAPNYPVDAFPDGIKINFYFTGVKNGCKVVESARSEEIYEGDLGDPAEERTQNGLSKGAGLDCVHEMDTINHYVGMFPIVTGAPLEQAFSKYIFVLMGILLLGFMMSQPKTSLVVMGVGFIGLASWMVVSEFMNGGIVRLVDSYSNALGTYFKDAERIYSMSETLRSAAHIAVYCLVLMMVILFVVSYILPKSITLFPVLIALLPLYFIADFGSWLWFFGHNLHPWGAFTLKPFMPTVFGEGKVAQFATYSYPSFGFGILMVISILLIFAALFKRKMQKKM